MTKRKLRFILSLELLAEYSSVLRRPRIQSRHQLSDDEIDALLTRIVENAMVREAGTGYEPAPDRGDNHLWALLSEYREALLVTGDTLLIERPQTGVSVVSPRTLVETMGQ